jgi:carotenoid cleavage dioxygenase-like enzyme
VVFPKQDMTSLNDTIFFIELQRKVKVETVKQEQNTMSFLRLVELFDDILTRLQNPKNHLETNPYLHDNYAPVTDEHVNIPVEVTEGKIPDDLEGIFVRIGPNPLPGWSKRYHWFDGHGMLHNLRFKSGKITYTNQFVKTPRYVIEKRLGKDYFLRIGELVGVSGIFKAIIFPYVLKAHGLTPLTAGPANTDTVIFNHKLYVLNEGNLPFEATLNDDGTLNEVGYTTFNGVLNYPVSAHPKIDYHTNSMLFHSYSPDPQLMKKHGSIKFGELLSDGSVRNYRGIFSDHTSFAHDMMITKNWIVLYDSSVHFDISKIVQGKSVFNWKPDSTMKVMLVCRKTGEVMTFDVGRPHSIVHPMNAWEENDGTVVMWAPIGDHMDLELDSRSNCFYMSEIRISPISGTISMERLDNTYNQEFCSIRRDFYGRYAQYGVAGILDTSSQDGVFRGFIIWDLQEKKPAKIVHFAKDEFGGEPVVIAKPETAGSRDFYIGTFVYNSVTEISSFLLYEEDKLVARLNMPYRVPYGFHGKWYPESVFQCHIKNQEVYEVKNP